MIVNIKFLLTIGKSWKSENCFTRWLFSCRNITKCCWK